jgi:hypothetical protein
MNKADKRNIQETNKQNKTRPYYNEEMNRTITRQRQKQDIERQKNNVKEDIRNTNKKKKCMHLADYLTIE